MAKKQRANIVLKELKKLYPQKQLFLNSSNKWEFLVAVILSARATDKKVNEVTEKLFKKYNTFDNYLKVTETEFAKDINQIGLYKSKAERILKTAKILDEKYKRKIPKTMEELLSLPGVGRKTANVILSEVYGIETGIVVDTHVMRLSHKFGLVKGRGAHIIEKELLPLIPEGQRHYFSNSLIAYGREYSPARRKTKDDLISLVLKKYEEN